MKDKIFESGWWNGLPAKITCCMIRVIPSTDKPMMWYNAFAGQTRQVVEITQDDTTFIIDNQHGDGFHKVTIGRGGPRCGSKHFGEFKLLDYVEPMFWNRILDEPFLAGERLIIEEYQERINPEEFKKVKILVDGLSEFQAMTPEEQVAHIRKTMMPFAPAKKFTAPPSKQHHSVHKKDGKGKR